MKCTSIKFIKLTQGQYSIVDECDFEHLSNFKWNASISRGCWRATRSRLKSDSTLFPKMILFHRFLLGLNDKTIEIDHIDGDPLNNSRENLRLCSHLENSRNRKCINPLKFKGVRKNRNKWEARMLLNKKYIYLGLYANIQDAARAYDKKAKELHGDFARLNFP